MFLFYKRVSKGKTNGFIVKGTIIIINFMIYEVMSCFNNHILKIIILFMNN